MAIVFNDTEICADLIKQAQRGRAQALAQIGDFHLARLGRYVVCFKLSPLVADYSFYEDVLHADLAFSDLLAKLESGQHPPGL
jgi:hypothetical protein